MSKLICITGPDGSGKSTIIQLLQKHLQNSVVAAIWDALESDKGEETLIAKKNIDRYLSSLSPDSRILFLAHALKFSIDKALQSQVDYIFINAYYYKYFCTELALGASEDLVRDLGKTFPVPDITFFLVLPLAEASRRKQRFSSYECGLDAKPSPESFLKFQQVAEKNWSHYKTADWKTLNSLDPPQKNVETIINLIAG